MTQILIADDEASIRTILMRAMEKKGFQVFTARNGREALECLRLYPVDVAIVDIRMPELTGLELLSYKKDFPSNPIILMVTAQDTMENAVEAMKRGAYDYLTKPFDLEELSLLLDRVLETRRLWKENQALRQENTRTTKSLVSIVGQAKPMQEVFKTIGKVADQNVTVLVEGESGTGKELIAKAIHYQGSRAPYPFVAVNCSAIPAHLLESELFGTKKGAFTGAVMDKQGYFEKANLGTLFLDEIGDMPIELQAKLLRVLQEKEIQKLGHSQPIPVDVRIVAATNLNLADRVREGHFRKDLFFRLNVVPITLPPLRERREDIPLLIDFFLAKNAEEFKTEPKRIDKEAVEYLKSLNWPGNIRELENLIKRVFVLSQGAVLDKKDFNRVLENQPLLHDNQSVQDASFESLVEREALTYLSQLRGEGEADLYRQILPLVEKPLISLALKRTEGNQIKASKILGINRNTLRKKMRELGL